MLRKLLDIYVAIFYNLRIVLVQKEARYHSQAIAVLIVVGLCFYIEHKSSLSQCL